MSLLFKPRHIEQIRAGEKTVTRRVWAENYARPNVGSVQAAVTDMFTTLDEADCFIEIVDIRQEPLGEMTDADAQKEGDYETVAAFRDAWADINGEGSWDPEQVVDVVCFEYVGREHLRGEDRAHV